MIAFLTTCAKIISAVIATVKSGSFLKEGIEYVVLNKNMIISTLHSDNTLLATVPGFIM